MDYQIANNVKPEKQEDLPLVLCVWCAANIATEFGLGSTCEASASIEIKSWNAIEFTAGLVERKADSSCHDLLELQDLSFPDSN